MSEILDNAKDEHVQKYYLKIQFVSLIDLYSTKVEFITSIEVLASILFILSFKYCQRCETDDSPRS